MLINSSWSNYFVLDYAAFVAIFNDYVIFKKSFDFLQMKLYDPYGVMPMYMYSIYEALGLTKHKFWRYNFLEYMQVYKSIISEILFFDNHLGKL